MFMCVNKYGLLKLFSWIIILSYFVLIEKHRQPMKVSTHAYLNQQHVLHYIRTILIFSLVAVHLGSSGKEMLSSRFLLQKPVLLHGFLLYFTR